MTDEAAREAAKARHPSNFLLGEQVVLDEPVLVDEVIPEGWAHGEPVEYPFLSPEDIHRESERALAALAFDAEQRRLESSDADFKYVGISKNGHPLLISQACLYEAIRYEP